MTQLVEAKRTAAEVELILITRKPFAKRGLYAALEMFASFISAKDASLAQNAHVLGDVILRQPQFIGQLTDGLRFAKKSADDTPAALITERFQHRDTVSFLWH
jgi:hypothetical protein